MLVLLVHGICGPHLLSIHLLTHLSLHIGKLCLIVHSLWCSISWIIKRLSLSGYLIGHRSILLALWLLSLKLRALLMHVCALFY